MQTPQLVASATESGADVLAVGLVAAANVREVTLVPSDRHRLAP